MTSKLHPETAGHNIVADPSFSRRLIGPPGSDSDLGDWKKVNTQGFSFYNEGSNSYIGLIGNQRIWQDIALPVAANGAAETRPSYSFSCLYDATLFSECSIEIYRLDNGMPSPVPLYTGSMQGNPPPRIDPTEAYLTAKEIPPKNINATWHQLPEKNIAIPADVTHVRVVITTPPEPGGRFLYIRNIVQRLQLSALNVDILRMTIVESNGAEIVQQMPPFRLCHGATHRLEVKAAAGDHWQGQKLSLLWMNEAALLPAQFGLDATPDFNLNDADREESYQVLDATDGASWLFTASGKQDSTLSGECPLGLGSYWQADKTPFSTELGDFRYDITDLVWDGVSPVISAGNSTTLTATVSNTFEPQRALAGKEVAWLRNGEEYCRMPTDENGHAVLVYRPEAGAEGNARFTAVCTDALAQQSERTTAFRVFADSPWLDELEVLFDGQPVTDPDALTLRLTRDARHRLQIKPKSPDSYFINKEIVLNWPAGGAPALGIEFYPGPDMRQVMPLEGLEWFIVGGGESGIFTLALQEVGASALPVPLSLKGVQLSSDLADEAELKVMNGTPANPTIFRRGQAQTLALVPKASSPLRNMTFDGWLQFVSNNSLSAAQMPATPAYAARRPLMPNGLTWSLTGADVSGTFGVEMHVAGFTTPIMLDSGMLLSTRLNDEAELKVANAAPATPVVFRRARAQIVSVVPKSGSPLSRTALKSWMTFTENGNLTASQVTAAPGYDTQRPLQPTGLTWTLTGGNTSGRFGIEVHMEGFLSSLKLDRSVLLSLNLADEADLYVGNAAPENPAIFRRGQSQSVRLVAKPASPLGDITPDGWLKFVSKNSLSAAQLPATPAYDAKRPLASGDLGWTLTGANVSGTFGLEMHVDGFTTPLRLVQGMLLSLNLADEAELKVGGVAPGNPTIFRRGQAQGITVSVKPGSPLGSTTLNAWVTFIKTGSLTQSQMGCSPAYGTQRPLASGSLGWTLTGENVSGLFGVEVHMTGFHSSLKLDNSMLLSLNLADEVELTTPALHGAYIFWRTGSERVGLTPRPGSPLASSGLSAGLTFRQGNVTATQMPATPAYGAMRPVTSDTLWWTFREVAVSGRFGLEVTVEGFATPLKMEKCALLSVNMEDEAELRVDDAVTGSNQRVVFRRQQGRNLRLVPKAGSALGDTTLTTQITFTAGTLAQRHMTAVPAWGNAQTVRATGAEWFLTGADVSGTFGVEVKVQGLWNTLRLADCGLLAMNIEGETGTFASYGMINSSPGSSTGRSGRLYFSFNRASPLYIWGGKVKVKVEGMGSGSIISSVGELSSVGFIDILGTAGAYGVAKFWYSCEEYFSDSTASRYPLMVYDIDPRKLFNLRINGVGVPLDYSGNSDHHWITRGTQAIRPGQDNTVVYQLINPAFRNKPELAGIPVWVGTPNGDFTSTTPPANSKIAFDADGRVTFKVRASSSPTSGDSNFRIFWPDTWLTNKSVERCLWDR